MIVVPTAQRFARSAPKRSGARSTPTAGIIGAHRYTGARAIPITLPLHPRAIPNPAAYPASRAIRSSRLPRRAKRIAHRRRLHAQRFPIATGAIARALPQPGPWSNA